MRKAQGPGWDVWAAIAALIVNAGFNAYYVVVVQEGTVNLATIAAVYKKIDICITSTSILLATSGFWFSASAARTKDAGTRMVRAVGWFVVALFSGILNVAAMPTRLALDSHLEKQHAAEWLWVYGTGPLMYISLILGAIWLARALQLIATTDGGTSGQ